MATSRLKPRKSSLISNLLNRVDGQYLAIRQGKSEGIEYYFENNKTKALKANKASLELLSYEELEILISGMNLPRQSLTVAMFKLEQHLPEKIVEPKEKKTFIVNKHDNSDFAKKKDYSNDVNKKDFRKNNNKKDVQAESNNRNTGNNKPKRKRI